MYQSGKSITQSVLICITSSEHTHAPGICTSCDLYFRHCVALNRSLRVRIECLRNEKKKNLIYFYFQCKVIYFYDTGSCAKMNSTFVPRELIQSGGGPEKQRPPPPTEAERVIKRRAGGYS